MQIIDNLLVGKADVKVASPSHFRGVREGNQSKNLEGDGGFRLIGTTMAIGTARRSTGINPADRDPVDRRSPNLSPP